MSYQIRILGCCWVSTVCWTLLFHVLLTLDRMAQRQVRIREELFVALEVTDGSLDATAAFSSTLAKVNITHDLVLPLRIGDGSPHSPDEAL